MDLQELPTACVIMDPMSDETRARLLKASRTYNRLKPQFEDARKELADAIVAERKDGALIEDITALVPYRQTQVNRILKAAGLTEERPRRRS
jgi:hypothetical protein